MDANQIYDWLVQNWPNKGNYMESTSNPASTPSTSFMIYNNTATKTLWTWDGDKWKEGLGGGTTSITKSANFTASVNTCYLVDSSSGAIVVGLPSTPNLTVGDFIEVMDIKNSSITNNITIDFITANQLLDGISANFVYDENGAYFRFVWSGDASIGWKTIMVQNSTVNSSDVGDIKKTARATAPLGWLICDGTAISRTTYANLFSAIGTTYGIGDGSTTFNIPDLRGRTVIGAGQSTFTSSFANTDVNISTDIITVPSNNSLFTGTAVVISTTGTAPTGLTAGTTYYVIRLSSTTIKLATTLANAVAGTAINITGQGVGIHTLTTIYTNRALGEVGGEENHALTINEMPSHTHTFTNTYSVQYSSDAFNTNTSATDEISRTETTNATGGSDSHNNMMPYLSLTYLIKF